MAKGQESADAPAGSSSSTCSPTPPTASNMADMTSTSAPASPSCAPSCARRQRHHAAAKNSNYYMMYACDDMSTSHGTRDGMSSSPDGSVGTASTACSSLQDGGSPEDQRHVHNGSALHVSATIGTCDSPTTCTPSVLMVPPANDNGDDINLMQYLGEGAVQRTANDPHVEMVMRAFERRVYLSKNYTNSKEDKDGLKKMICDDAQKRGTNLNASCKGGAKYPTLEFQCRDELDAKKGRCAANFILRWDGRRSQWYVKVGSGCSQHSAHKPTMSADERQSMRRQKVAESGRKKRRLERQDSERAALAQFDLAPSSFQGDAATHRIVAAAAMAASVPRSKPSGEGTCYLCKPNGVTKSDQMLELASCSCDSFHSQHYWLGPALKISRTNAVAVITDEVVKSCVEEAEDSVSTTSDEIDDIAEPQPKPARARTKPKRPPFEIGINRRTKQIDEMAAQSFNGNLPFFDQMITKPVKALKAEERPDPKYRLISFSGFPANSLPGSQSDVKNDFPLFQLRKGIIKAGKNVYASVWKGESESFFIKSSSKYYTLLLRDHNKEGDVSQSGICSIYFRPLETTKYWWLSYLTTVKVSTTSRKGYGTMIIWRMINLARRAEGVEEIWLEVQPDLTGVQQMYERLGFEAMQWEDLPLSIANYEMEYPDVDDPHKTKKERVYKHWGEFVLMRLDLSIFPPLR